MAPVRFSRRKFLSTGAAIGSVAVGSAVTGIQAKSISGEVPWSPGQSDAPQPITPEAPHFFEPQERAFIDAAVERLIPADNLGPGAREAGVTTFIDAQLAGPYGRAETWYMQGPWSEGTDQQGYQSRLTPAQTYRAAIKSVDDECRRRYEGKSFAELPAERQDELLSGLEKNEVALQGVNAKGFFELLLQNTLEGFWSDPIYGGNRDMAGWKLIGFPGARYDYRPYVDKHGMQLNLPPVGLKGRPGWTPST
jgi:gluconate 2-dehydrogenase gamma chain